MRKWKFLRRYSIVMSVTTQKTKEKKLPKIYCRITYLHSKEAEEGRFDRIIIIKVQCEECQGLSEFKFGVRMKRDEDLGQAVIKSSLEAKVEVSQIDTPKWCPSCSGVFPDSYPSYLEEAIRNSYLFTPR
jgi:hypothetical protein